MRILLVHNYYGSSAPSGENVVFEAERDLLRAHGHEVQTFTRHSDTIRKMGLLGKIVGALSTICNPFAAHALARLCREFKPDIVHFHNTFPLISLWAVRAAAKFAPVVMTLHNYRLLCAAGIPARNGRTCTLCMDSRCVCAGLRHRCYRNSFLATLPLAFSIAFYRRLVVRWVSRFIVFSEFQKRRMETYGFLPSVKVKIKPNFIASEVCSDGEVSRSNVILYVGRLSDEKGVKTLISAWRRIQAEDAWGGVSGERLKLVLIGDGDCRGLYERLAEGLSIEFLGKEKNDDVRRHLAMVRACVLPSECFEGMPMTVLEALSAATPCVVSNLGALPSLVKDGQTGFVFKAGDVEALTTALLRMVRMDESDYRRMCRAARENYERRFTPERNYEQLMAIYKEAGLVDNSKVPHGRL